MTPGIPSGETDGATEAPDTGVLVALGAALLLGAFGVVRLALVLVIGRGAFRRTAGAGPAALAVASLAALLGLRPEF